MSPVILILCAISAILAITMLFTKSPITSALCLLGILILSAGIYGLIGEHMVATIQLVVYAGAIMVLFIFSIMLLNLSNSDHDLKDKPVAFFAGVTLGLSVFGFLVFSIFEHYQNYLDERKTGFFTSEAIAQMGGNSRVLSHALFSQYYVSFEVISLALLVGVVGAVVLAKRKFD